MLSVWCSCTNQPENCHVGTDAQRRANGFTLVLLSLLRLSPPRRCGQRPSRRCGQLPALDVRQRLARLCWQRMVRQTAQPACHRLATTSTPAYPPLHPPPKSHHSPRCPRPALFATAAHGAWHGPRPAANYYNGTYSQRIASAVVLAAAHRARPSRRARPSQKAAGTWTTAAISPGFTLPTLQAH